MNTINGPDTVEVAYIAITERTESMHAGANATIVRSSAMDASVDPEATDVMSTGTAPVAVSIRKTTTDPQPQHMSGATPVAPVMNAAPTAADVSSASARDASVDDGDPLGGGNVTNGSADNGDSLGG